MISLGDTTNGTVNSDGDIKMIEAIMVGVVLAALGWIKMDTSNIRERLHQLHERVVKIETEHALYIDSHDYNGPKNGHCAEVKKCQKK